MVKILRICVLVSSLSLVAVVFLAYYFQKTVVLNPYVSDGRLVGLSYEIMVDLYGAPEMEDNRIVTWEDGRSHRFVGLDMYFPMMRAGDSVLIKHLRWMCGEDRQRDTELYWNGSYWSVFRSVEAPHNVPLRGPL